MSQKLYIKNLWWTYILILMNYPIRYILLAFHFVYESEEIISHLLTSVVAEQSLIPCTVCSFIRADILTSVLHCTIMPTRLFSTNISPHSLISTSHSEMITKFSFPGQNLSENIYWILRSKNETIHPLKMWF